MRFPADQLRDKALLALEDAVQECRYRTPRRSHAVRFALAYLWAYSGCNDRRPYNEFWRALLEPKSPWSFSAADHALLGIYVSLGLKRDDKVGWAMWRSWQESERSGGPH
jgi:hypothetical protein